MNANWNGLLGRMADLVSKALSNIVCENFGKSKDVEKATQWYSVFASGPGHLRAGQQGRMATTSTESDSYTNGGVNHFGSPFNFPEEFVTRLSSAPTGS